MQYSQLIDAIKTIEHHGPASACTIRFANEQDQSALESFYAREHSAIMQRKSSADTCLGMLGDALFKTRYYALQQIKQAELTLRSIRDNPDKLSYLTTVSPLQTISDDQCCQRTVLYHDEHRIIAVMNLTLTAEEIVLEAIYVAIDDHHQSHGSRCIDYLKSLANQTHYNIVLETSIYSMHWYQRLGFLVDVDGQLLTAQDSGYDTDYDSMTVNHSELLPVGFFNWQASMTTVSDSVKMWYQSVFEQKTL